jgi:hypothetical protein
MDDDERFSLTHDKVGSLPIVNWFLARMGVSDVLERYLPHDDARLRLAPARVIELAVRNIICSHKPLYAMGEWAAPYEASLFGLKVGGLGGLNDDRVGRMLDRLFDADRALPTTGARPRRSPPTMRTGVSAHRKAARPRPCGQGATLPSVSSHSAPAAGRHQTPERTIFPTGPSPAGTRTLI